MSSPGRSHSQRTTKNQATSSSGCRRAWRCTALDVKRPAAARCHHFEPVWRLTPAARAAEVIVHPAGSASPAAHDRAASAAHQDGPSRAPSSTVASTPTAQDSGPQPVDNMIGYLSSARNRCPIRRPSACKHSGQTTDGYYDPSTQRVNREPARRASRDIVRVSRQVADAGPCSSGDTEEDLGALSVARNEPLERSGRVIQAELGVDERLGPDDP